MTYAIWKGKAYRIVGEEQMARARVGFVAATEIPIPWGDEDLVIDPTDSQLEAVGFFEKAKK